MRSSVGDLCLTGSLLLEEYCSSIISILARIIPWWTTLSFCRPPHNTLTSGTRMAERWLCQYATWRLFPRILKFTMMFFQHLMYWKTAVVHMVMNCYMRISEMFKLLKPLWFPMLWVNHFDVRCAIDDPQIDLILKPGVNDVIFNVLLLPPHLHVIIYTLPVL